MSSRPPAGETPLRQLARRVLPYRSRKAARRLVQAFRPAADRDQPQFAAHDHEGLEVRLGRAEDLLNVLELHGRIQATAAWIAHAPPAESLRITVITGTYNRRRRLEQALASVRAQSYSNWEHVVVDDGSSDETPAFLAAVTDKRVRALRIEHAGLGAARNAALDVAAGSVIVYLDDDNHMHPDWLRAVAWAFSRFGDVEVLYGARIVEDWSARAGAPSGEMPRVEFVPYDRAVHERINIIDANVMAHRAGLPEGRFLEGLAAGEDWDLGLRLTATRPPLALPAVACLYATLSENRMCHAEDFEASLLRIRAAHSR